MHARGGAHPFALRLLGEHRIKRGLGSEPLRDEGSLGREQIDLLCSAFRHARHAVLFEPPNLPSPSGEVFTRHRRWKPRTTGGQAGRLYLRATCLGLGQALVGEVNPDRCRNSLL